MKVIGITGSIASGKSEASRYFLSKGYNVIDADYISRNVTKKGNKGYFAILEHFDNILNEHGQIDRKKLSDTVFNDKSKLKLLNSLLHPIIFDEIDLHIKSCRGDFVFLDAPLLFETDLYKKCNEIILIYCDESIQIKRMIERDNMDIKKAKSIIKSQMSVLEKKLKSSYTVENNNSLEELYLKLDNILNVLKR